MPYCSRCGVELPADALACALCATPVQFPPSASTTIESPYPKIIIPDRKKVIGMLVWIIVTTIFCIAALSLCAVNLFISGAVSWSIYPVTGIATAWIYSTIAVFLIRRRWIASAGWIVSTIAFLAALNALNTGRGWFWPLAFPLTIISGLAIMAINATITHCRSISGILAIILATSGIICVGIDFAINRFLGQPRIGWSFIALSTIVPLEAFLLVYYSYLRKRIDLRRYFHV